MDVNHLIEDMQIYIEKHLEESITLDEITNAFHMSKYYTHRLFKAMTGFTLYAYVLERKLNYSLALMENDIPLTDIAYQLEFGSQTSFIRAFKKQYQITPSAAKKAKLKPKPIPSFVKRDIQNLNGDIVKEFDIEDFNHKTINGLVFHVDVSDPKFRELIESKANTLIQQLKLKEPTKAYMFYSNCLPNSPEFNVIFGVETNLTCDLPDFFSVPIDDMFAVSFRYNGSIMDISDVVTSDFARFMQISKRQAKEHDIELFQVFDSHLNLDQYKIYVPIEKEESELEMNKE